MTGLTWTGLVAAAVVVASIAAGFRTRSTMLTAIPGGGRRTVNDATAPRSWSTAASSHCAAAPGPLCRRSVRVPVGRARHLDAAAGG